MFQGKVRQRTTLGKRMTMAQRLKAKWGGDRKDQLGKQMVAHGGEFIGGTSHRGVLHDVVWDNVDQVGQSGDMVQMRMTQENIEVFCLQIITQSAHPRAGIQRDADVRQ
jgi:hypothetical protein